MYLGICGRGLFVRSRALLMALLRGSEMGNLVIRFPEEATRALPIPRTRLSLLVLRLRPKLLLFIAALTVGLHK
jgi:hypothetical protein